MQYRMHTFPTHIERPESFVTLIAVGIERVRSVPNNYKGKRHFFERIITILTAQLAVYQSVGRRSM